MCRRCWDYYDGEEPPRQAPYISPLQAWENRQAFEKFRREKEAKNALLALELDAIDDLANATKEASVSEKSLKPSWTTYPHKIERLDGLAVTQPHPALFPLTQPERPIWVAELPDSHMRDPWKQAALEAKTIEEAVDEADRRFPMPNWHTSKAWKEQGRVRLGRRGQIVQVEEHV